MEPEQNGTRRFLLSFFLTFLALSVIFMLVVLYAHPAHPKAPAAVSEPVQESAPFIPDESHSLNLFVVGGAKDQPSDTFLIIRFDPVKGTIPVIALPPETYLDNAGKPDTLSNVYEKGGLVYSAQALSRYLDIPIDRYARMDLNGFLKIAAAVGTVEFDLPYDVTYLDGGLPITITAGRQLLNGQKTAAIISNTDYEGGALQRGALLSALVAEIINQRIDIALSTAADDLFKLAVNLADTDISAYDYERLKEAAVFMAKLADKPSVGIDISGRYNEAGNTFVLSDSCQAVIKQAFN